MKNLSGFLMFLLFISTSCSTGKKALQKGEYFSAVSKAVDRLKSAPDNRNATKVLKEGFPMAIEWSQEEMDMILSNTTRIQYKNYEAKIKTFTDEVNSGGVLDVKIFEFAGNKLMQNDRIPGSFKWINDYAIYVGDIEALDKKQIELTQRKAVPLPPKQDLFIEFTKPIYDQLTVKMNNFFRRYN